MGASVGPKPIPNYFDQLSLCLDASNIKSNPGGSDWIDIRSRVDKRNFNITSTASFTTMEGISCVDKTSGGQILNNDMPNLGDNYTLMAWAHMINNAQSVAISNGWRTLFRCEPSDHPIAIPNSGGATSANKLGMYQGGFQTYNIDSEQYANKWTLFTAVGFAGVKQFIYINDGSVSAVVSNNATGESVDYIGGHKYVDADGHQPFGYIAKVTFYDRAFDQSEIKQHYDAQKARFGH